MEGYLLSLYHLLLLLMMMVCVCVCTMVHEEVRGQRLGVGALPTVGLWGRGLRSLGMWHFDQLSHLAAFAYYFMLVL